jgi:PAS domain S-box-containing protein
MVQRQREGEIRPEHRDWSLRSYMALFMVVLLAVAALAAFSVRYMSDQDARRAAIADADFAAGAAAAQLTNDLLLLQKTTSSLALNPNVLALLAAPAGTCSLTFGPGHIDVVSPDGTIKCSSQAHPGGTVYGTASWLPAALRAPVTAGPFLDPVTGKMSAVVAGPVGAEQGVVAAIFPLAGVATGLASNLGGARHLEFLITTEDGKVLTRSLNPDRWMGASLAGTSFAVTSGPAERRDLDGMTRLYGRTNIPSTGWAVFAGADEAAALSSANLSGNRFLVIILAGVTAMLVVVLVVYRRVAEPVRRLSTVIRSGATDRLASVAVGTGAREVTGLAEDFDKLMATIKHEEADRLATEEKVIDSERNYRSLFESHPHPMWLYDVHTLAFLRVNDAAIARYGYSRDEFLAMTIKDIRPPEAVEKFLETVDHPPAFEKSGPWTHLLKDGSTVQVLVTSHAVSFGEKEARFVLAEDLSEGQRLELELHQSQARAEANAALGRAKDEMVSLVSHEMRTPLASIVGFTELLTTRDVTPEQRKEFLSVMLQEGHRLTALINDFLDLRRIEGGHMTMSFAPADIGALIKRVVDVFGKSGGSAITTNLGADLPLVRADSDSIFRVVANLLSNAKKYSPEGGAISISATSVDGMVEISVKDEGLGIPPDDLSHLFQKFYRVDTADRRAIRGTGLGLAISKNIVEAHGGTIGATSAGPGQGSVFYFTLPEGREQSRTGDVLIIEDDSGFAHLLQAELATREISSVWASDAETAEQLIARNGARAIVLDLLLPGMSGEAFLQRMRTTYGPAMPVVVITLKDLELSENLALQKLGVSGVLRKGPGISGSAADLIQNALAAQLVAL